MLSSTSPTVLDLGIGVAIGYCSGKVMDKATGWFLERQSEASRRREEEIAPGGTPELAGKKLARLVGGGATDAEAARIGLFVYGALRLAYGIGAAALVRAGIPPMRAAIMTGAAAFLVVDEGVNSTLFTPPPQAYPIESHLRGVVGHIAYGVAAGAMLAVVHRLGVMGP